MLINIINFILTICQRYTKYFPCIILFISSIVRQVSSPCYRREYRNIEHLSNLTEITQAIEESGFIIKLLTLPSTITVGCTPSWFIQVVRPVCIGLDAKSFLSQKHWALTFILNKVLTSFNF